MSRPGSSSGCPTTSSRWRHPSPRHCGSPPPTESSGCSRRLAYSSSGSTPTRRRSRSSPTCSRTRPATGISTGDGVVTLDLSQLVSEIGTELGVPDSALAKIPPDTGVITIMRSDQLSAAQAAVQGVRVLSAGLLILVLALFALAIYLARGERRQALRRRRDDLRGPDRGRDQRSRAGGADAQRAPRCRLGRRRGRLPPARPLGRHARTEDVVGHRTARRADRRRRRGAASPDVARVPRPGD